MILHKLPPFQNVGASQTATLPSLPLGMTYMGIVFKLGGTFTKAQMTNIRARMNGKQFVDVNGDNLDEMNEYMGLTKNAAYLTLPFGDIQSRTIVGESIGAIDTSEGVSGLDLEVDIGAATAPTLEAWAVLAPPKAAADPNKRTIRAFVKSTHAPAAAGEFSLQVPVGSVGGALIQRVFMFHANITKLQVTKDGLFLMQEGEEALLDFIQAEKNRTNVAGLIVFDPTHNDNQSESITTLRPNKQKATFEWKTTVSAADTIVAYSSIYTSIDRL